MFASRKQQQHQQQQQKQPISSSTSSAVSAQHLLRSAATTTNNNNNNWPPLIPSVSSRSPIHPRSPQLSAPLLGGSSTLPPFIWRPSRTSSSSAGSHHSLPRSPRGLASLGLARSDSSTSLPPTLDRRRYRYQLQTGAATSQQDHTLRMQLARVEAEIVRENQEFEAARKQNAEHIERMENLKDELALQNQRLQLDVIELEKEADDREEHSKWMLSEIERLTELVSHRERLIQAEKENIGTLMEGIRRQKEDLDKLLKHNACNRARIEAADSDILQLRQEAAELESELRAEDHTLQNLREKKNKMERRFSAERETREKHREYQEELMDLQNKNREARIFLADREAKLERNRRCISASEIVALSEGSDESKENHRSCRFEEDTAIVNNCLDRGREKYLKEILSMMREVEDNLDNKVKGLREAALGRKSLAASKMRREEYRNPFAVFDPVLPTGAGPLASRPNLVPNDR